MRTRRRTTCEPITRPNDPQPFDLRYKVRRCSVTPTAMRAPIPLGTVFSAELGDEALNGAAPTADCLKKAGVMPLGTHFSADLGGEGHIDECESYMGKVAIRGQHAQNDVQVATGGTRVTYPTGSTRAAALKILPGDGLAMSPGQGLCVEPCGSEPTMQSVAAQSDAEECVLSTTLLFRDRPVSRLNRTVSLRTLRRTVSFRSFHAYMLSRPPPEMPEPKPPRRERPRKATVIWL